MNDIFIEYFVKKKRTIKDRMILILTILGVILVPVILVLLATNRIVDAYFIYIALFVLIAGGWFIWFVRSNQKVEFEYQIVQDYLVVSKVIDKRKRKEIARVDVRSIESITTGSEPETDRLNPKKTYECAADPSDDDNTYYALFHHPAYDKCVLIFTPNDKILNGMKPYLKKDIVLKLFYHR